MSTVWWWFALAVVLLLQNYPNHLIYTRMFMTVVRDVENVEIMLQQITHPLLSAVMVLSGARTMCGVRDSCSTCSTAASRRCRGWRCSCWV
ncbi:hypothetical protein JOF34_001614 [Microbacterium amylolyticum]|uniref:Uncharacterized protein n=1 Tax=Microbacterium amylolyticum TaxID=936337 RepID=A0ABS4ZJ12_9MICO|nr:hypothetical protein [Microbacterium amylolyticum]